MDKIDANTTASPPDAQTTGECLVLNRLKKGYNTVGRVIMDPKNPWSASKYPFYVIISREGVLGQHTAFRLISKLVSVGAFTFSTALFASSALVTILVATVVMVLVLVAGIFGRVTAMWISAIIMRDRPVLHRVVKDEKEASVFMEVVLAQEDIICEVLGHVVINGRCVGRYGIFRWSTFFGVLAPPYDVTKIATRSSVESV